MKTGRLCRTILLTAVACACSAPSGQTQTRLPPVPGNVKPPPQAVTPKEIRVSDQRQAGYSGPMRYWFEMSKHEMVEAEVAEVESTLRRNPEDVCTRGRLIASGCRNPQHTWHTHPSEHVVWMINHRPDWEGFLLDPQIALTENLRLDASRYAQVREAWLGQVGPEQKRAPALHNAAMFFAMREPEVAETLLKRAIELEPGVQLYLERLGVVYAQAHFRDGCLRGRGVMDTPERQAFADHARAELQSTKSWILLEGALRTSWLMRCVSAELMPLIGSRLTSVPAESATSDSKSPRYAVSECVSTR